MLKPQENYKVCAFCGFILEVGEVCDCMLHLPKRSDREYSVTRHKDGSIHYYGFPKEIDSERTKYR